MRLPCLLDLRHLPALVAGHNTLPHSITSKKFVVAFGNWWS
jgi:hypothetical protein